MRITTSMLYRNFLAQVQRLNQDFAGYNEQISSGKRLNKPSDDPPDLTELMSLRDEVLRIAKYTDNIVEAMRRLESADSRMNDATNALIRLIQLTEQAANSPVGTSGRRAIAVEVKEIQAQILSISGSQVADRYLFSGTRTTRSSIPSVPPGQVYSIATALSVAGTGTTGGTVVDPTQYGGQIYVIRFTDAAGSYEVIDLEDGNPVATGTVAVGAGSIAFDGLQIDYNLAALPAQNEEWLVQPQYVYNGTDDRIQLQVDENTTVIQNAPGSDVFGGTSGVPGGTIFDDLVDLRTALLRDDENGILSALDTLNARFNDLSTQRAIVGSNVSNLRLYEERSRQRGVDILTRIAELENVNLPEAISKLVQTEGGLQAALQVGARLSNFNLFNYLR
jgi:flagellin-like hook-associated protein FlgL